MTNIKNKALIYVDKESEPMVIEHGDSQIGIAAASEPPAAPKVANQLVQEGAELIELCGGISTGWLAEVSTAVPTNIPIGLVTYPFESLDTIAEYKARFESKEVTDDEGTLFIIKSDDADPSVDRIRTDHNGSGWTEFVAVNNELQAAYVAAARSANGATLVELYGGFDLETADTIHKVTNGEIPIGVASYSLYNRY